LRSTEFNHKQSTLKSQSHEVSHIASSSLETPGIPCRSVASSGCIQFSDDDISAIGKNDSVNEVFVVSVIGRPKLEDGTKLSTDADC
jgi:hypothetical protein